MAAGEMLPSKLPLKMTRTPASCWRSMQAATALDICVLQGLASVSLQWDAKCGGSMDTPLFESYVKLMNADAMHYAPEPVQQSAAASSAAFADAVTPDG